MVHTLAEKRCADFGTYKDGRSGAATANTKHLGFARQGRNKILAGDCFTVVGEFDAIVDQMTVPLIQGMLKYAFKADPANTLGSCETAGDNCDKAWAEGWAFAAAVRHACTTAPPTATTSPSWSRTTSTLLLHRKWRLASPRSRQRSSLFTTASESHARTSARSRPQAEFTP